MNKPHSKGKRLAVYLDNYTSAQEGDIVYGRDVAVNDFLKGLLLYGQSGEYKFYQSSDALKKSIDSRQDLLDIAKYRNDLFIEIKDINSLKSKNAIFDFDIWHETDADFAEAISLRERYCTRPYPISAAFNVLSYQSLLHDWYLEILLKKTFDYDTIICNSTAAKKGLLNIFDGVSERLRKSHNINLSFKGNTEIIPLGVDTNIFKPGDKKELRLKLGLPLDAFIILWIGRISPFDKADLLPLLLVFQILVKDNPNREIKLVIGGSGENIFNVIIDKCIVDLHLTNHIILIRPLPASLRHFYHACADVFVSPADNIQETFGITPLEAMACGIPQVVSDWNGYRDTVKHGQTGFLIPTYMADLDEEIVIKSGIYDNYDLLDHFEFAQTVAIDLKAFLTALQALIDSPALCKKMSENSRERAVNIYDWKNIIYLHEQLWQHQLDKSNKQVNIPVFNKTYDTPAFYKNFNHYASAKVIDTTIIEISLKGTQVVNKQIFITNYYAYFNDFSVKILHRILIILQIAQKQKFKELTEQFRKSNLSPEKTGRHIMFLLKYGYLQIGDNLNIST
ncbi:MAG: glycosyltransferase family 4 protein [Ginsengibacter sp.]